jgi:hypothetical protein
MQTLPYSSLNEKQLAQVAYLFADQFFGSDASAFVYEVDGKGEVKGRALATKDEGQRTERTKAHSPINVNAIAEVNVTEEMINTANMHMDALAAAVAQKLYQSQFEEVHHE